MIHRGVVVEIENSNAKIAVGGGQGCNACASKESCVSITGTRPEEKIIVTENLLGVKEGDIVELELPVTITMQIIFVTFILPVALLITGYFIMLEGGATQGAIGAVSGLVVGMILAISMNRSMGKKASFKMRMTKVLARCSEEEVSG